MNTITLDREEMQDLKDEDAEEKAFDDMREEYETKLAQWDRSQKIDMIDNVLFEPEAL